MLMFCERLSPIKVSHSADAHVIGAPRWEKSCSIARRAVPCRAVPTLAVSC